MENNIFSSKTNLKGTVAFAVEHNLPDELLKKVFAESIECIPAEILRESLLCAVQQMNETELGA